MIQDMNGASVIGVFVDKKGQTTVYLRISREIARPIDGGCVCSYCKAHPDEIPMWDTLAVPASLSDYAWTVHCPDRFRAPSSK